ncbi:hypothetical protein LE977_20820, partial [Mycobacterium avium]|nr:hypothetical protein [Mycobacterium avium]
KSITTPQASSGASHLNARKSQRTAKGGPKLAVTLGPLQVDIANLARRWDRLHWLRVVILVVLFALLVVAVAT